MSAVQKVHIGCGRHEDQLDGVTLGAGEVVLVKWPKSTSPEVYAIHIDNRERDRDRLAYIVAPVNGTTNRVYLRWQPTVQVEREFGNDTNQSP